MPLEESLRPYLLSEVALFIRRVVKLQGVVRIAIIGSLVTEKARPKDADVLVTIEEGADMESLAAFGRRLKGKGQSRNSGADIFLCNPDDEYLGRTCSWRECHPRMRCSGKQCALGTRICDDFDVVRLDRKVIQKPPLIVWPKVERTQSLPKDVEEIIVAQL